MKKCLAVLLTGLILMGFGTGAAAQTPAELEAEGRALLAQTTQDLKGNFTIEGKLSAQDAGEYYVAAVRCDGAYAFIRADGVRDIHFKDKAVRVYLERNAYHEMSASYSSDFLPLLTPKEVPENISVSKQFEATEVSFNGCRYWYKNGSLWSIDNSSSLEILIEDFRKQTNPGIFSLDGLQEVPELQKWLWEPEEALALFLAEHPTLDRLFGKALSAAITALVVVFSPLLYLLVLVMRVLFYFDLYRV